MSTNNFLTDADYADLVNLRNRLHHEGSGEIFEEDSLLLDRVLDLLEKPKKHKMTAEEFEESIRRYYIDKQSEKVERIYVDVKTLLSDETSNK